MSGAPAPARGPESLVDWSVAERALPGQSESGDAFVVQPFPGGVLVAAIDGLGHGRDAAEAAGLAVETLAAHAPEPVTVIVERCHEALRRTRGAVMSLASFHAADETMIWTGVGNVDAVLFRLTAECRARREFLLLRGGVVGYQLPPLRASTLWVAPGDTLVLATDGVRGAFYEHYTPHLPPHEMAEHLLASFGKATDDALVLVARWLGG